MRPYSMDLRRRVVAACDRKDERQVKIAERLGVSTAWIRRLLQRRRETGSIAPFPQNPGRKPALDEQKMERLRRIIGRQPDATLRELKERLGVRLSDGAMIRALGRLQLTLKKSRSKRPSQSVTMSGNNARCGGFTGAASIPRGLFLSMNQGPKRTGPVCGGVRHAESAGWNMPPMDTGIRRR